MSPATFTLGAVAIAILAGAAIELTYGVFGPPNWRAAIGGDLATYTEATRRVFTSGTWYLDRQLHGPYPLTSGDVLYPPVTALVFAPFLLLPAVLWIVAPVAVIGWLVWTWHPKPWAWPLIALCLLWPLTLLKAISGNPSAAVAMLTGLALRYRWPAFLILLKPSLGPFALIGIRDRRWWLGAVGLVALSLPWLALSLEWPTVVLNAEGGGPLYSAVDLPMVAIPIVAWLARR